MIYAPSYEEKFDYLGEKTSVFNGKEFRDSLVAVDLRTDKAVYDYDLLLEGLISRGMTEDQARDWIDVNVVGTCGEDIPIIIERFFGGEE